MFNTVSGIKVDGGFFKAPPPFMLFQHIKGKKQKNVAVIYGKNGSGKTSLAQAVDEYKKTTFSQFSFVEFLDNDESPISSINLNLKNIHIFDETFINNNVRFKEDERLDAIVLLGETVHLVEKIQTLEARQQNLENLKKELNNDLNDLNNPDHQNSPKCYKKRVETFLKNRWAKEGPKIDSNRIVALAVSENVLNRFLGANNFQQNINITTLEEDYKTKLSQLDQLNKNTPITKPVITLSLTPNIDESINLLLSKLIKKPEFSDREIAIIDMLKGQKMMIESMK